MASERNYKKMNNYERIKSMSIEEMAIHQAKFSRAVIDGVFMALNIKVEAEPPLQMSIDNQKKWLLMESEVEE